MKRFSYYRFVVASLGILFSFAEPSHMHAQSVASARKPEELTSESDLIAVGRVGGMISEWTPNKERIQTRVTLSIDQTIKGNPQESTVTIVVPGGEVDGVGEWYSHSVRFEKSEDVVVFAKKTSAGEYRVAGGEAGKFSVRKDPQTGLKVIPNIGSVQQFAARIKHAMELQQLNKR